MRITLLITFLSAIIGLFSLSACSGPAILNSLFVPHSGYTLHKNIAYGTNPRQQLDIYVPDTLSPTKEVIVFFYGGSWKMGDKKDYLFVGQAFASRGYITVIADYRLYPEIKYPDFMHDNAKAFSWVHSNIANYGGDADKLYVAGHSAGAYNAALLTLDETYLHAAGAKREWIKGMIGIAGPYDFRPSHDPNVGEIFKGEQDARTQPIHYVAGGLPPMFLATGDADEDVYPRNTYHLAEKLRDNNNSVEVHSYPKVGHIGIILSLANGFRSKAPLLEDIDDFIDGVTGEKNP